MGRRTAQAAQAEPEVELTLEDDVAEPDTAPDLELEDDEDDEDESLLAPEPVAQRTAPNPLDQMVPISRLNEQTERAARAERALDAVSRQPAVPATPARRGYVDPNADAETQTWQGRVEQLIGPAIRAEIAQATGNANMTAIEAADAADDTKMRGQFEDYDELKQGIESLRMPYMQRAGTWLPRLEFYHAVLGQRQAAARAANKGGRSKVAVQRQAAPARERNAPPAQGRRAKVRITPDMVGKMSLQQMESVLMGSNARVL